ncbi:MAG: hypothetical protein NHF95_00970 [Candidatus Shikimatogenerans sp. JK-2022]|nr:hypothetical protein [Candidatus Shikimatogenerans bostrichidophilus]
MKKIIISLPLITTFDKKYNIDYFSLEKLILFINNLNIDNIILFDNYSEIDNIYNNEIIDIINCIQNNINKKINLFLKINNIYNYEEINYIITQNIFKNIYYIIIDYPYLNNKIYKYEIINNYNKIFKKFKYLKFFFNFNNKKYINEENLIKIKLNNNNFIGIINKTNFFFKKIKIFYDIKIYIYNDYLYFKYLNYNIDGIISPLFYLFYNYINNNILNYLDKKNFLKKNKKYYYFLKFIKYFNFKVNPISYIKFFLKKKKICKKYVKLPSNDIKNYNIYNKINDIYNIINL